MDELMEFALGSQQTLRVSALYLRLQKANEHEKAIQKGVYIPD